MEKLSNDELKQKIELCREVHNNKYSYDKVRYINYGTKVIITCPEHGDFEQNLYDHSKGRGCNLCRREKMKVVNLKGREDFIKKSNITHNNKYSYDKVPNQFKVRQKVTIICPEHGEFHQTADSHKRGCGCPYCAGKYGNNTNKNIKEKKNRINHFIDKHKFEKVKLVEVSYKENKKNKFFCEIHGEFSKNNSQVSKGQICGKCLRQKSQNELRAKKLKEGLRHDKFEYIDLTRNKITVKCKEHNHVFEILTHYHVNNKFGGCIHCLKQYKDFGKQETNEVIEKFRKVHGNKYGYDNVDYHQSDVKVSITCKTHGDFLQTPASHLSGCGCPNCKTSLGEKMIQQILKKMNLKYVTQKTFFGCSIKLKGKLLQFDIYVPEFHTCIEFDGIHHFTPVDAWGGEEALIDVKNRDKIKNEYCEKNEIDLIRIPYTMGKSEIVDLLNAKFNKNVVIHIEKRIKWIDLNIKDIVSQYKTRAEFSEKNKKLYKYCSRNKLLNYVCDFMERGNSPYTFETAKEISEKYTDYTLFEKERPGLTAYIRKNNLHELTKHMVRKKRYWTDDMVLEEIKKYKNKLDVRKNNPKLYNILLRRGYINKLSNTVIFWNEEKVIEAFKNSSSKKELGKKYRGAENWSVKKGLYHEYVKLYLGKNI